MSGDFRRLQELFDHARGLSPTARAAYFDAEIDDAPEIRSTVLRLLRHYDADEQPLEEPVALRLEPTRGFEPTEESLDPTLRLGPGSRLGSFRIVEAIGAGGMGVVYEAEQVEPRRSVALKIIRPELATEEMLKRFRFEASVLARIEHPGIGTIYESGFAEVETPLGARSLPYIAMELVRGRDLVSHCRTLDTPQVLELFRQVCDAVDQAHRSGFIHRDLKPGNILITEGGHPKVLDFGVARAMAPELQVTILETQVGQIVGSIPYMSPEQVGGDPTGIDHRSDVYSLGVILYQLLAGHLPLDLRRMSLVEATRMIADEDPSDLGSVNSRFRGDLSTIVNKALEKDPARRYATAADLSADLERHLADEPIHAHAQSSWYKLKKFSRRNRGLVTGLAVAALFLIVGSVVSTTLAIRNGRLAIESHESELAAERVTYRTSILASIAALKNADLEAIQRALADAPEGRRGWEWHYLDALVRGDARVHRSETRTRAVFDDGGVPLAPLQREGRIELVDLRDGSIGASIPIEVEYEMICSTGDGGMIFALEREREFLDVWDLVGGSRGQRIPIDGSRAFRSLEMNITPNADGTIIAVDRGPIIETRTGTVLGTLDGFAVGLRGETLLEWDFRGVESDHGESWFQLRNARSAEQTPRLLGEVDANAIAWSADGSRVIVRERWGRTRFLDLEGTELASLRTNNAAFIVAMHLTASNTLWESTGESTLRSIEPRTALVTRTIPTHVHPRRILVAPDESSLVVSDDTGVEYRSLDRGPRVLRGHASYVYCVTFSPDGAMVASGADDGTVRLWDATTGEPLAVLGVPDHATNRREWVIRGLGFTPDGTSLLVVRQRRVDRWDLLTGGETLVWAAESDEPSYPPAVSEPFFRDVEPGSKLWYRATGEQYAKAHDRDRWVWASWEVGITEIFDLDEAAQRHSRTIEPWTTHELGASAVAFDRTGRWLATGGRQDERVRVWDATTGELRTEFTGHGGEVFTVDFNADGTRLASGGRDGLLRIWDLEGEELIAVFEGHDSYIHALDFSPDGSMIATASGDGTVRVWDAISKLDRAEAASRARALEREIASEVEAVIEEHGRERGVERLRSRFANDLDRKAALLRLLLR